MKMQSKAGTPVPIEAKGAAVIALRKSLAVGKFIEAVVEQFGLTDAQALDALEHLVKLKLVTLDGIVGQFQLRDGRFWDRAVMRRAAGLADEPAQVVRPGSVLW